MQTEKRVRRDSVEFRLSKSLQTASVFHYEVRFVACKGGRAYIKENRVQGFIFANEACGQVGVWPMGDLENFAYANGLEGEVYAYIGNGVDSSYVGDIKKIVVRK